MISLQEAIKQAAHECDVDFRQDYSGRGMFGRNCVGITGTRREIQTVLAQVILMQQAEVIEMARDIHDGSPYAEMDAEMDAADDAVGILDNQMETLMSYSEDSMGLGMIAYWPQLEWQGDTE